jgi:endoribonuclease Dicer
LCSGFEWPPLDFGWSLADVLRKSKESAKDAEQSKDTNPNEEKKGAGGRPQLGCIEEQEEEVEVVQAELKDKSANELLTEEEKKLCGDWMEIGTWSNDMANHDPVSVGIPACLFSVHIQLKGKVVVPVFKPPHKPGI